jgi:uncharacterized protein
MQNHSYTRTAALITGASSGIGYELTKLLVSDGFDVVLVARDEARLKRIADELIGTFNVNVTVIPKDLSRPEAAGELYREVRARDIEVNILVNNAGFSVYGPFAETSSRKELEMIHVNLVTLTQLTKLFLPGMLNQNSGKILNVASTAAFAPGPYSAVYSASKAYVLSFSEAIAEEVRGTAVSVTTLCPGPTKTEFAERAQMMNARIFQGRLSSAAEVAEAGYRALMRKRTTVVVGLANRLLVFSMRFSPRRLVTRVSKVLLGMRAGAQRVSTRSAH